MACTCVKEEEINSTRIYMCFLEEGNDENHI